MLPSSPHPRNLNLEPQDWFWATWRDLKPLQRPDPEPFNLENALAQLRRIHAKWRIWNRDWSKAKIAQNLSREEAHFWLIAMTTLHDEKQQSLNPDQLETFLRSQAFDGNVSEEMGRTAVGQMGRLAKHEVVLPLSHLFSGATIAHWILHPEVIPITEQSFGWRGSNNTMAQVANEFHFAIAAELTVGFRRDVVPYLDREEREKIHEQIQAQLPTAQWPNQSYGFQPTVFYLAAYLGGYSEQLEAVIANWTADLYVQDVSWATAKSHWYYPSFAPRPQELIFGLQDPQQVAAQMRRVQLKLYQPDYIKAWLAHTEYSELDWLETSLQAMLTKDDTMNLMRSFLSVEAPEIAPVMINLLESSSTAELANRWLTDHPELTMAGLLQTLHQQATGSPGTMVSDRPLAIEFLKRMARRGHEDWMREWLTQAQIELSQNLQDQIFESVLLVLDATTTPDWLQQALKEAASLAKDKLPKWLSANDVEPLSLGTALSSEAPTQENPRELARCLNPNQVELLLKALRRSTLETVHPLITVLKQQLDGHSLANFAWNLYELWEKAGAPTKDQWAFWSLGLLGSDATALQLVPLIRTWPKESKHKRAAMGLECLRSIGTSTALMQIHDLSQKLKFQKLKEKAISCMEQIARSQGLTEEELADRIVPDCGLNERGTKVYSYGTRTFQVILSPELKLKIRDDKKKLKASLPKPTAKDDAALAEQAIADWNIIKKTLPQIASLQAKRLERAMIDQRRWSLEAFETYLVHHPLMTNLVQRLVWSCYDAQGLFQSCFRVTEDQTYADEEDQEIELSPGTIVGLVHPAELADAARNRWGELLSDYELLPPFRQLNRTVFALEPDELEKTLITRFEGTEIAMMVGSAILSKTGWHSRASYCKSFDAANLTAILDYYNNGEILRLGQCYFVPGIYPEIQLESENAVPLRSIPPVVASELLRNVGAIVAKAEN
jgi:hypothetical protein